MKKFTEIPFSLMQAAPQQAYWENMLWFGGFVLAGLVLLLAVRHFLQARADSKSTLSASFSLGELRDMRDRGELTLAEYETLRKKMIAATVTRQGKSSGADDSRRQ